MTKVKICGVRTVEHAAAAAQAGADFVGLVFASSRRQVDPGMAKTLSSTVKRSGEAQVVGIFVNESPNTINSLVKRCALDYVQLSGDEDEELIERIEAPVIKTMHVDPKAPPDSLMHAVASTAAELVLLDTAGTGLYGGTGQVFDWSAVPALDRRVLVAGGLHAGNVRQAIDAMDPWGVDVSGGVETDGVKDEEKIREFIRTVKFN